MPSDQPVATVRRSIPNALKVIVLTAAVVALLLFLWRARSLFLTIFLAVIAGLALAKATDWLQKHHIKRSIGAPLTMLVIISAIVGVIAAIAPTVRRQTEDLTKEVPKALQKVRAILGPMQQAMQPGGQQPQQEQQQQPQQQGQGQKQESQRQGAPSGAGRFLFSGVMSTFEALAGIVIIIFVAIYIAVSPHTYRDGIMHLVPHPKRARADEILTDLAETLRGWLTARLIAMVVIGVVTGGILALLGIRAALALAVIAGLMELIPFYGPIIAAVPAIGIALVDSPQKALSVAIVYLIIQQFEGNLLTPLLLKRRLEVPPVLTVVAVTAFGVVFGVLGMLVAEPLTAGALIVVKKLYVRDVIGDDIEQSS